MNPDPEFSEKVRVLIGAENDGGAKGQAAADGILGQGFLITRNDGAEEDRGRYLDWIAKPDRPSATRSVSALDAVPNAPTVIRSIVTLPDGRRYRNIHVFGMQKGVWKCVAWQVTALPN